MHKQANINKANLNSECHTDGQSRVQSTGLDLDGAPDALEEGGQVERQDDVLLQDLLRVGQAGNVVPPDAQVHVQDVPARYFQGYNSDDLSLIPMFPLIHDTCQPNLQTSPTPTAWLRVQDAAIWYICVMQNFSDAA